MLKATRILIAEDETLIAEELRERLQRMGLTVVTVVGSGEEAIARSGDCAPDLVLMDIRLRGNIDGIEAAAAIRERFDIPVIFLTAHSDKATIERAKHIEPLGYVLKPFAERELRVTIEMALHKRLMDRLACKLLEAQKLESLAALAGGVAHNFNNLLAPIIGGARLAELEVEPDSNVARYLTCICDAAETAADLCRQMLAYSRNGKFVIRHLDVNAVIRDTEHLLRLSIAKGVTVEFDLASELPLVEADQSQIQQVLLNLVTNASEAITDNGRIIVRTWNSVAGPCTTPDTPAAQNRHVVIEVADNGSGMDDATRQRAFEPFFTTKFQGRGLGLAAARGIARGHHGDISIEGTPGGGATLKVYLPASDPSDVCSHL